MAMDGPWKALGEPQLVLGEARIMRREPHQSIQFAFHDLWREFKRFGFLSSSSSSSSTVITDSLTQPTGCPGRSFCTSDWTTSSKSSTWIQTALLSSTKLIRESVALFICYVLPQSNLLTRSSLRPSFVPLFYTLLCSWYSRINEKVCILMVVVNAHQQ